MSKGSPYVMGRTADYQATFVRQHSGPAPAKTAGVRGWGYDLRDGAICVVAVALALWLLGVI